MYFHASPALDPFAVESSASSSHTAQAIPPPAVATINGDAIDLNDEVFFPQAGSSVAINPNYSMDMYHVDESGFAPEMSHVSPNPQIPGSFGASVAPPAAGFVVGGLGTTSRPGAGKTRATNPPRASTTPGVTNSTTGAPDSVSQEFQVSGANGGNSINDSVGGSIGSDMSDYYQEDLKSALSTPDLAFAEPVYNVHYSHQLRFSTAVDQMHRMSLHTRSPSEEKTINPRQLLGFSAASLQNYVAEKDDEMVRPRPLSPRYLSTSASSPQLSTLFSQVPEVLEQPRPALNNPLNPYVMNDECVSAITYWLNNTADVIEKEDSFSALIPPARAPKWNRRNSIQVPEEAGKSVSKRKRRKSDINHSLKHMLRDELAADTESRDLDFAAISEADIGPSGDQQPEKDNDEPKTEIADDDDGPKPFPCPDCDKQFKRSEHLKRHIRSVHSNIRPFHCKYCEKKFSRSDNLAQHSKTHFKLLPNGETSVIYGNLNPHNRGGRKQSISDELMQVSQMQPQPEIQQS